MPDKLIDAKDFIRRMATPLEETSLKNINFTIWHLFAEKKMGFMFLFDKVFNQKSAFWKTPLDKLDEYIGRVMRVAHRKSAMDNLYIKMYKAWYAIQFIVRQKLRKLSF